MNHSCDPNAFVFFENGQLRARSLKTIHAGDEITQSYTDVCDKECDDEAADTEIGVSSLANVMQLSTFPCDQY